VIRRPVHTDGSILLEFRQDAKTTKPYPCNPGGFVVNILTGIIRFDYYKISVSFNF